jgi:phosphonate transport system substrate-binding protein
MRKYLSLVLFLLAAIALMSACAPVTTPTPEPTEEAGIPEDGGKALVLGDISDDPAEVIEGTQPIADYLAERMSDHGYTHGEVRVAASADEMAELLRTGEVDLYMDSAYPAMLIADASGAQPILRRWRRGVEEYHTIIFSTKESGVESLEDLNGKLIAFDNELSTSGFVLPAVFMVEEGLTLIGRKSFDEPVSEDAVGFVFSFDDENTLQWVISGEVAAGATDNVSFGNFPEEVQDNIVVLAETESVPRQIVLVRPEMDEDVLAALIDLLTTMHENEEGLDVLDTFEDTARFDEFPEGIEAALARMRELQETIAELDMP